MDEGKVDSAFLDKGVVYDIYLLRRLIGSVRTRAAQTVGDDPSSQIQIQILRLYCNVRLIIGLGLFGRELGGVETLLANVIVIGAFVTAYYIDKKRANRTQRRPQLYPLPVLVATNPEDSLCKCYQPPSGIYPVFVAGSEVITVQVEGKPSYHCQDRPLEVNPAGKTLKMAWRVCYPSRQAKPMERGDDGTWSCEWIFTDETCSCGPENIYHEPGRCTASYSPAEQSLTLQVLKESKNCRIGPP